MNWQTPKLIAETLCLLAVAGSAAFFAWDTHQTQVQTRAAVRNLSAAAYSANLTIASLSGPCRDFQGDYVCPPLTQLSQTEKNIGILAAKSSQQTMQVGTLVTAVAHNLDTVGDSVKQAAGNLSGTAQAATGSLDAATALLKTANDPKTGLPDILGKSDAVLTDFQTWERSKALSTIQDDFLTTLGNVKDMTGSSKSILADSATEVHSWTHPNKKKLTFWTATEAGGDYARHFMPSIF